jgi:hypothetical protein
MKDMKVITNEKKKDSLAELEDRVMARDDEPAPDDEYGNIHHPKKHLLTGLLYALAGTALLGGAALVTKLLG